MKQTENKQKRAKKKGSKDGILKRAEYLEFVRWCATPDALKEEAGFPRLQKDLAKKLGVDDSTLSDWRKTDGFWEDVEDQIKRWMKDRTQNVLGRLYTQVIKEGKAQEVKLWLQYGMGFSEKIQVEDKSLKKVFDIEKMLRKIAGGK